MRLSLVTPAYNQCAFLAETIDSVLSQEVDLEYVVIDDGSTDDTVAVLERFGHRVEWLSRENRGQTATINEGWRRSTGEVVGWLNSDDTLLPGAARTAMEYLTAHAEVDIVYGTTVFTDSAGTVLGPPGGRPFDYPTFVRRCENPIPQPSAFIRRRVLDDIGLLDESLYYFMDWDYWLRAGVRHGIVHIAEPLSTYRLHDESKSVAAQRRFAPELVQVYERFFGRSDLPPWIVSLRREGLLHARLMAASYQLHGGDARAARRAAARSAMGDLRAAATPAAIRKLAYCLGGSTSIYRLARRARQRFA